MQHFRQMPFRLMKLPRLKHGGWPGPEAAICMFHKRCDKH